MVRSGKWIVLLMLCGGLSLCSCDSKDGGIKPPAPPAPPIIDEPKEPEEPELKEFILTQGVDIFGNTYITSNEAYGTKLNENGISEWTHRGVVVSSFFKVPKAGALNVALYGKASTANGAQLSVTVAGTQFDVKVTNTQDDTIRVGQVELTKAGYVRVDMKGEKGVPNFGAYSKILLGGAAATERVVSVPLTDDWAYWGRRGPSVHMKYTKPSSNIRYFYNEVTVPVGNDVLHSYFMSNGFSGGYMGMQVNDKNTAKRRILFSVWSAFKTDKPSDIPQEYRVLFKRKGEGVTVGVFGNEGSGGQSYLQYPWEAGKTYKFLTEVRPNDVDGTKKSIYTGYFCGHDGEWRLIASFMRPDPKKETESHYENMHSFLENFDTTMGHVEREVLFRNQWAYTTDGRWIEITEGTFTYDATAAKGIRLDYSGGMKDGGFYLRNCGFFDDNTSYGTKFTRPATLTEPIINFDALENLAGY